MRKERKRERKEREKGRKGVCVCVWFVTVTLRHCVIAPGIEREERIEGGRERKRERERSKRERGKEEERVRERERSKRERGKEGEKKESLPAKHKSMFTQMPAFKFSLCL
jgi:hypothetical protein